MRQLWWDARLSAIESLLGKSEELVGHAPIPFELGPEEGGAADVIYFKEGIPGVVAVTAELIGRDDQVPNALGNYELAICHRDADDVWGPDLISRLAYYTLEAELNPGETMEIGPAAPDGATITALMFTAFGRFQVRDRAAGLLLCIGITADELDACMNGEQERVEAALKASGVFPYTDLYRPSVLRT
ncbi:MAG: suppressor of fused domain protein [Bacillota bacterium]